MKNFYSDNKLMSKYSAGERGIISPLMIGGVVVLGIIVFLIASGSLKFSGYIRTNSNQPQSNQNNSPVSNPAVQPSEKPTEAPKPEVKLSSEPFTDSKLGFSLGYPEGWKVKSQTTNVNIYKPSDTKGGDKADALVTVATGDLGELKDSKLATIADLHKVYIKKQFSNVEFTGEKEIKVNNQDGYELDFTGSLSGENMQARYILLKGEKYLYALIGMANIGMWKDFEKALDASIQTFKLQ